MGSLSAGDVTRRGYRRCCGSVLRGEPTAPRVVGVNRLSGETSPYLRQHRENPVDWFPWGQEAFDEARRRDVPVLLSVGYSACHWCHVMAHECFEDDEVARAMNERFVNIKVDREERPDVDSVYMDAVIALTGRGGWPLTAVLDHDGRPFWGGTYYPKPAFLKLIDALTDVWENRRDDLDANATALVQAIGASSSVTPTEGLPSLETVNDVLGRLASAFDDEWGGFGQAPKFPSTFHLELIMRAYMTSGGGGPRDVTTTTLDAMASGGMYDHLGGGFARYSVDRQWLVPHFEKMLYDQALLIRAYRQGWSLFRRDDWRLVVEETVGYVLGTLRDPAGGIHSAEDADSPAPDGTSVEGWFYTWTPAEVREVLGEEAEVAMEWFGISESGNFEGRSIPNRLHHRGELIRPPEVERLRQRLLEARASRPRPGRDDKVLTEWNALFISSLLDAAAALERPDWVESAEEIGQFLVREMRTADGRWLRSWQAEGEPRARHGALAADHAALVDAFTRLGEATGRAEWTRLAVATADTMLDHFWDAVHGGLFTTADDAEQLVVRQKDLHDQAVPSANSTAALALIRLAALTGESRYLNHADRILALIGALVEQTPTALSNALAALEVRHRGITEVVIPGDQPELVRVARAVWRPDMVLAWGEPFESPLWTDRREGLAYVCRDHVCDLPVDSPPALLARLTGSEVSPDPAVDDLVD